MIVNQGGLYPPHIYPLIYIHSYISTRSSDGTAINVGVDIGVDVGVNIRVDIRVNPYLPRPGALPMMIRLQALHSEFCVNLYLTGKQK